MFFLLDNIYAEFIRRPACFRKRLTSCITVRKGSPVSYGKSNLHFFQWSFAYLLFDNRAGRNITFLKAQAYAASELTKVV